MITPIELQSKTFKTGIGYDKKDVDNFLNELLIGYETLYKERMEFSDKINTLNEGLNYYKTIEKTLQKALVLAEQTAEDTKESARMQAKAIVEEARGNAQLMLADASNDFNRLQQQTIQLIRQYDAYKAQFKHLAAAQCEFLESDSFQIHIANLNTFIGHEDSNNTDKDETADAASRENVNTPSSYMKKNNNSTSINDINTGKTQDTENDFEFYDLNEGEQE